MGIIDLFSKRQKRLRGQVPDVYSYDDLNEKLRVQIIHIIRDVVGEEFKYNPHSNEVYAHLHSLLCREYGLFSLRPSDKSNFSAVFNFFLECSEYEKCLDVVEQSFRIINGEVRQQWYRFSNSAMLDPDSATNELNIRFKEHGVGYQFVSGEIVRIDSQFIHSEAVKPALLLLGSQKEFRGANDEFLKAHEHYRHGRHKECLVECLKALESLIKAICHKNSWAYDKNDTAKKLIGICFEKDLIPAYMQNQFSSLRSLLESGVPTVRNKEGGHGQGAEVTKVPGHLASYALHLCATNMLFLAESHRHRPNKKS